MGDTGEDMTRALQVAFTVMAGLLVVAMVAMWRAGDSASAQDLLGPGMSAATKKQADKQRAREEAEAAKAAAAAAGHGGGHEAGKRTEKPKPQHSKKAKVVASTHPWLANTIKGHTGRVTAVVVSQDDKFVGSASDDRTIRLWPVKALERRPPPCVQFNVDLDHATMLAFAPDGKACVAAMGQEHVLRLYRVDPKDKSGNGVFSLKQQLPAEGALEYEIVGCGLSVANPMTRTGCTYVMAATAMTELRYFSIDGTTLQTIDTKMIGQVYACLSPNGHLTAVCGRLGMVRLLEVQGKGDFIKAATVMDLTGHSGEAQHCSFSLCSTRLACVGGDGSWVVWDVDVEFDRGGDAKKLASGQFVHPGGGTKAVCALSPDLQVAVVGCGVRLFFFSVATSELLETIDDAHTSGEICGLTFDAESRFVCSSGGMDKRICVWKNIAGARFKAAALNVALIKAGKDRAASERIQASLDGTTQFIASVASV
eukprot:m.223383 g.223383  ORF g.223383 m.223383 type:complete len:482 (-) comp25845_c0_seq1:205-1650(-)